MIKNDNPHSLRLVEAIRNTVNFPAAEVFSEAHPLSKSADVEKKYRWACEICAALEEQFSPEEAANIRRSCRCGDGTTMAREIAGCISKAGNLADGCAMFSAKNKYAFLEYISENEVIFGYHTCVCSCVKRAAGEIPALWCECSAGYAEAMFRQVFGDSVRVRLLGSAKSGAERCTFHVQW